MENHEQGNTGELPKGNTAISMATVKRKNIAGHPEVSGPVAVLPVLPFFPPALTDAPPAKNTFRLHFFPLPATAGKPPDRKTRFRPKNAPTAGRGQKTGGIKKGENSPKPAQIRRVTAFAKDPGLQSVPVNIRVKTVKKSGKQEADKHG